MKKIIEITKNEFDFSDACYSDNSILELREFLAASGADKTDCEAWEITPTQWRRAISAAIERKLQII